MAYFTFNEKEFYIDNQLNTQLSTKVIPQLKRKDKDVVFIVDGAERIGKSVFGMQLGGYAASLLKTKFDLSNICMTPEEFRKKVMTAEKNEVVIYDEAHRGMGSRRALSEINNILIDLMMEMGQKNLFVLIILPTFFMLDRYPALFRAKGLFHVYERKNQRGYWCYFNLKKKLKLFQKGKKEFNYNCMKWPGFRGRFFDQYTINEEDYRKKKALSFVIKERETRAEHYIDQRNILLYSLFKKCDENVSETFRVARRDGFELKRTQIQDIITEMKKKALEKPPKDMVDSEQVEEKPKK